MAHANAASFEVFFQGWLVRQRKYLEELVSAQQHQQELQDSDKRELINRVLCHYGQYFEEKSKVAQHDILLVFSPPWFSSLERTFLWVAGFKPGKAFHVVNEAVEDLTEDQRQRLSQLSQETRLKERDLNDELAKTHESVAAPPVVEMARSHGRVCLRRFSTEAEVEEVQEAPSELKVALEKLVASADALRTNTALGVLQILRPNQAVNFLAAVAELQLRIGSWGLDKDAQSGGGGQV